MTISYTELLCPSYQRKTELKNRYMFECSCSKCLSPLEEDGLMLSLQCSDFRCNGAVPRDLLSNILRNILCNENFSHSSKLILSDISKLQKVKFFAGSCSQLDRCSSGYAIFNLVQEFQTKHDIFVI